MFDKYIFKFYCYLMAGMKSMIGSLNLPLALWAVGGEREKKKEQSDM